jgi:hypothetical protein
MLQEKFSSVESGILADFFEGVASSKIAKSASVSTISAFGVEMEEVVGRFRGRLRQNQI